MKNRHLLGLISLLCLVASDITAPSVEAQRRDPDYLILARICSHEAGWDGFADCAAIYSVLTRLAEDRDFSFRTAAYAYSGRLLRGETTRSYHAELREDGARPVSWPEIVWRRRGDVMVAEPGPAWSNYRDRWLALLEHARSITRGEVMNDCVEPPDDWGGRVDRLRAASLGLIEIDCGDTRNDFYARPSRREAEGSGPSSAGPEPDYVPPDDIDPE